MPRRMASLFEKRGQKLAAHGKDAPAKAGNAHLEANKRPGSDCYPLFCGAVRIFLGVRPGMRLSDVCRSPSPTQWRESFATLSARNWRLLVQMTSNLRRIRGDSAHRRRINDLFMHLDSELRQKGFFHGRSLDSLTGKRTPTVPPAGAP
jgi:hypothetical protein